MWKSNSLTDMNVQLRPLLSAGKLGLRLGLALTVTLKRTQMYIYIK